MSDNPLKIEQEIYDHNLDQWVADGRTGQVVVIKGDSYIEFYPSTHHACTAHPEIGSDPIFMAFIRARDAVNAVFLKHGTDENKTS